MTNGIMSSRGWETLFFLSQATMIVFFCVGVTFEEGTHSHTTDPAVFAKEQAAATAMITEYYPMWMDIHVMIFIGFGFLMVFLKHHSWSSVGFNYLIGAWAIQCGIVFEGFWHNAIIGSFAKAGGSKIALDMPAIINADFCAAAVLITMGGLLGKTTFSQLFLLVTIECIFYSLNVVIVLEKLHVLDIGGSLTIHMFGAYFGLAATYFFQPKKALLDQHGNNGGTYNSQLIAMVGTIFLFMYWPSFNGALAVGMAQQRAVINTLLSICTSTMVAVYVSRAFTGKIDMEVMLNATLAGGVVMGASCDLIIGPGFAMIAGAIAGAISAVGFLKLNAICKEKIGLHDTCGIQFLHGIPGTLGGFVSAITVAAGTYNFENDMQIKALMPAVASGRSVQLQACYQLAGMAVTWIIAIPTGLLFGYLVSRLPMPEEQFDDEHHFLHVEFPDAETKKMGQLRAETHGSPEASPAQGTNRGKDTDREFLGIELHKT